MRRPARLPLEQLEPYLLDAPHPRQPGGLPAAGCPLQWHTVFGDDGPVEIEVGFGKGLFLVASAQARPDVRFFGIEIERKYALFTATRLAKLGVTNVKLACTDARWLLRTSIPEASVQAVHVYFPDPWWKTRHRKRKLFTAEFAKDAARVLVPGGVLHFVTDVEGYYRETMEMLREVGVFKILPLPERYEGKEGEYLTNFERKYRAEGRPIWHADMQK